MLQIKPSFPSPLPTVLAVLPPTSRVSNSLPTAVLVIGVARPNSAGARTQEHMIPDLAAFQAHTKTQIHARKLCLQQRLRHS